MYTVNFRLFGPPYYLVMNGIFFCDYGREFMWYKSSAVWGNGKNIFSEVKIGKNTVGDW